MTKINPSLAGAASLVYSTYLGGNGTDRAHGIAVDTSGNAYVTGDTYDSTNFPTTAGAYQPTCGGSADDNAFMTKFNATGSALVYSTFLGSSLHTCSSDAGSAIAVDGHGDAYVTGATESDFPTTTGAFQTDFHRRQRGLRREDSTPLRPGQRRWSTRPSSAAAALMAVILPLASPWTAPATPT